MANTKDSNSTSGWRAETEPLTMAGEMEFLRWFYQNSEDSLRTEMKLRFMQEQQKAVPNIGLI